MRTDVQTNPHADPADPTTGAGSPGRSVAGRVTVALALVGLVVCAILLVADFRTDGVSCGSPASPKALGVIEPDHSTACGEELDTRRAIAWTGLGATAVVGALGCLAARSTRDPRRA